MSEEKKSGLDRRTFLKTAAATAGVVGTPIVVAQSPEAAKQEAPPPKPASANKEKPLPGDIVGIPSHGTLLVGDILTEGEVLQFVGIPNVRRGVLADLLDGRRRQGAHPSRQVRVGAAQRDGPRPPFLQGRVVQEGVGVGIQDLVGHG